MGAEGQQVADDRRTREDDRPTGKQQPGLRDSERGPEIGVGNASTIDVGTEEQTPDADAPTVDGGDETREEADQKQPTRAEALERGASLDRFMVIERLGTGGMGMVVAAYDPDLDRKVAIKVLRPDKARSRSATDGQQRLLREARALARLSHPNVTTVYEIGTVDDRVFIAMEYVAGQTMAEWLREKKRDWREVVDVMVQAGRGLYAAHEAGLVHRDFKPENVLIGTDGRVRVTDFGLVGIESTPLANESGEIEISRLSLSLSSTLTVAGALMGTPRYMSPEQHHRQKADARSDQFGFCAVLYEALYGQPAFDGDSYWGLASNVSAGKIRQPPKDTEVPPWLWEISRRGLSRDPEERFPSMAEVLSVLEQDRSGSRRRKLAIAGGALGFAALGALALAGFLRGADAEPPCRGARAELDGVWDAAIAERVEAALSASDKPYAADTAKTARGLLDDYAKEWVEMRTEVCEATHVRGTQSAALMDVRMYCLDGRRSELGALAELLAEADEKLVSKAVSIASKLQPLEACADIRQLTERPPLPKDPDRRAHVAAVHKRYAEANARSHTGKWKEALAMLEEIEPEAVELGYAPLVTDIRDLRGGLQASLGDNEAAEETLEQVAIDALATRNDAVMVHAAAQLVTTVGYRLGRYAQADIWGREALALAQRDSARPMLESRMQETMAMLRTGQGEYAEAKKHAQRAYVLRRQALGPDHPLTGNAQHTLGVILGKLGDFDGALAAYENVLRIHKKTLGERHPNVPLSLHNIGVIYKREHEYEKAAEYLNQALAVWTEVLPENHPYIGMALLNLGVVQVSMGKLDDAIESLERSRAIKAARLGDDHPSVAKVDLAMSDVWKRRGDLKRALEQQERALANMKKALGEDHPDVGEALGMVADTRNNMGEHAKAAELFRRALAIREAKLGADHPTHVPVLRGLADAEIARGRPDAAVEPLERALAIDEKQKSEPTDLAVTRFGLAQALWDSGGDRARARLLAAKALDTYRDAGAEQDEHRREVESWLAEHAAP